jgi:phospholipid/cholesterol/gamma-HCH transport system substrate-binding protein
MKQQVKIGIFLGGVLLILAAFVFLLGDVSSLFRKPGYSIYARFNSVAGLENKATVRMAGVEVGFVKGIRLENRFPVVDMSLSPWAKIPLDSKATLSSLGLLGQKYIEIIPSQSESFVPPGGTISSLASVSFDQIGLLILSIGDEVKTVSGRLQAFLGPDNAGNFRTAIENLAETSKELNGFLATHRAELGQSIESASQAFQDFNSEIKKVAASLDAAAQSVTDLVDASRSGVKLNLEKVTTLLDRMDEAARKLREILDRIDRGEGSLGRAVVDPSLYDKAEKAVDDLQTAVRPVSSLRVGADVRGEYYARSELLKGALTFNLGAASGTFVRAQIVRDPFRERFVYSLQGGKRWGPVAPRAGVFESDFGLGVDYYAFSDRLRLSLDGFDFNRSPRPRLRLSSRFFPLKHVFLILGLDDVIYEPEREVFFGLGLGVGKQ